MAITWLLAGLLGTRILSSTVGSGMVDRRSRTSEHVGGARMAIAWLIARLLGIPILSFTVGSGVEDRWSRKIVLF